MEKIRWKHRVRNEVLHVAKEERYMIHPTKEWKANWIGHIWHRN